MKPLTQNSMVANRYLVVQLIGKGGMGEVYLAVDQRLGSAVALKRTMFHEDEALGNAFEREAKILGRLRHPVLPKVIDHFIESDGQFLVMEHISGDDLQKRLENAGKPFPLSWVMFWADQLLDALNYLHSHEPPIIHRDIKPQNLKLTDDNHVVLLDFGLSKDFDSKSNSNPATSGSVVGFSPHFASMEQVRGTGTDARSDLYSLSATLYQLLTNTMPADALSRADDLLGGKKDPLQPIHETNKDVPAWVSEVIQKGLALRQDERFASASEMQKALRRAFNKGKAATAADTLILAVDDTQPPQSTSQPSPTDSLEFETKLRIGVPEGAEPKQSELKTEIFEMPVLPVDDKKKDAVPVPPAAQAAAAAGGSPSVPAQVAARPQAKKSKAGLMVGGLLGLLLLGGIAAGGGWYVYNNYYAGAPAPLPSPSVSPAASVQPTPEPTVEVVTESTNTNSSTITESMPETTNTETDTHTASRPGQQTGPKKTSQNPTAKSTPKPRAKDDRTVILQ